MSRDLACCAATTASSGSSSSKALPLKPSSEGPDEVRALVTDDVREEHQQNIKVLENAWRGQKPISSHFSHKLCLRLRSVLEHYLPVILSDILVVLAA